MHSVLIYAFVIVAAAPILGIWRGHVWAKANGKILRAAAASEPSAASERKQVA